MNMGNIIELRKHKHKRTRHRNNNRGFGFGRIFGLLVLLILAWYAYEFHLPRSSFSGHARIVDGDTIALNGKRVRFHAYDSPEIAQMCTDANDKEYACGRASTQKLEEIISGREVTCSQRKIDRYGRIVATCSVDGKDIGFEMVRSGNAVAYFYYTWRLAPVHFEAMFLKKGMWAGSFTNPYLWRKAHKN